MLRITVRERASEQRWILQGRLTKECIDELVSSWRAARRGPPAGNRIVDLNKITVIDKSGEGVLSMMIDEGTKFVATGLYTKHLLEALRIRTVNPSRVESPQQPSELTGAMQVHINKLDAQVVPRACHELRIPVTGGQIPDYGRSTLPASEVSPVGSLQPLGILMTISMKLIPISRQSVVSLALAKTIRK